MPIEKRYRDRAVPDADMLLHVVNYEVLPIGSRVREVLNRMLTTADRSEVIASAAVTVDWREKRHAYLTLDSSISDVFFEDPVDAGYYYLHVFQSGGGNTIAGWPVNVFWEGAAAPTMTATDGRSDLYGFYWNGESYLASARQDFG